MTDIREFIRARVTEYSQASYFVDPEHAGEFERQSLNAFIRILDWHENWPTLIEGPMTFESDNMDATDPNSYIMRMSQQIKWATEQEYIKMFGTESPATPIIRMIAAVWADHPDYDPEWDL